MMLKNRFKATLLAISLGTLFFSDSSQALTVSVLGLDTMTSQKSSLSTINMSGNSIDVSSGSGSGLGGGALLSFNLAPLFAFETGGLYLSRKYKVNLSFMGSTTTNSFAQHALEIPVLIRVNVLPYLSIGAGGYYAMGIGDVSNDNGSAVTTGSYSSQNLKSSDYGLQLSAAAHLPLAPRVDLLLDGRYSYGLSDVNSNPSQSSPAFALKYNDIQVLLGVQFHVL